MRVRWFFFCLLLVWMGKGNDVVTAQSGESMTIIALGDSTTAGTPGFFSPREVLPEGQGNPESQYAYWVMKRHPEWTLLNRGVRGQRTDQIARRFDYDVLQVKPDGMILLAGINDLYQGASIETIQNNLKAMYERAAEAGIRVMACTILPFDRAMPEVRQRLSAVNAWIREYAGTHGVGFADTYEAVNDSFRPGFLIGTPDGLHPDVETYRRMGDSIADALEAWLDQEKK